MSSVLAPAPHVSGSTASSNNGAAHDGSAPHTGLRVIRRNGQLTPFDSVKIAAAMTKAFHAVEGAASETSPRIRDLVERLSRQVVDALTRLRLPTDLDVWLTGDRGAAVERALVADKKRSGGTVSFVTLVRVGEPSVLSLPTRDLFGLLRPRAPTA